MSWAESMFASLPPLHEERTESVRATAPVREIDRSAAPAAPKATPEKKAEPQSKDRPAALTAMGGYSSMMLMANEAYTDIAMGTKGKMKTGELPCGDCIASIAEQMMG